MDIKQLTYFSAVMEHQNLSHAASQHNVAQSAVSHHISNLEQQLGVSLFVRKPRGMEPTAAGNRLYRHAKHILLSIKSAERDMMQETEEIVGKIAIVVVMKRLRPMGRAEVIELHDNETQLRQGHVVVPGLEVP